MLMDAESRTIPPGAVPRPEKNFGNTLQYGIFQALLRCGGIYPARILLLLVVAWYTLFPYARRRGMPYLARRFGKLPLTLRIRRAWQHYHSFGTILLERLLFSLTDRGGVTTSTDDATILANLVAEKGLIILSAHVGGWQGAINSLTFLDRPVNILQDKAPRHSDQKYFTHHAKFPVRLIDANGPFGGLVDAHAALRRNELLCIMGDRLVSPAERQVVVSFLGGPARFPSTAYHLSSLAQTPIAVVFVMREPYGPEQSPHPGGENLRLHLARVFAPLPREARSRESHAATAQIFALELERMARQYPFQFFNFYDMWDTGKTP